MKDKILIIDTHNALHRANIIFGEDNSEYVMIYNFFRNLRSTIELLQPTKVFFALERSS